MTSRTSLARRDPFLQDMFTFRHNFDDLFSRLLGPNSWDRYSSSNNDGTMMFLPPVESYLDHNQYHVRVALPGIDPKQVNIRAQGNELTISGERKQESAPSDDRMLQREFLYGAFERIVPLPEGTQTDKIEATYKDGVLDVSVPVNEKALPRRIEIKSSGPEATGRKLAA